MDRKREKCLSVDKTAEQEGKEGKKELIKCVFVCMCTHMYI